MKHFTGADCAHDTFASQPAGLFTISVIRRSIMRSGVETLVLQMHPFLNAHTLCQGQGGGCQGTRHPGGPVQPQSSPAFLPQGASHAGYEPSCPLPLLAGN